MSDDLESAKNKTWRRAHTVYSLHAIRHAFRETEMIIVITFLLYLISKYSDAAAFALTGFLIVSYGVITYSDYASRKSLLAAMPQPDE
jgi:hypothetical protein